MSNLQEINDTFKLPIYFSQDKMTLNENIITDLELIKTIDPSGTPLFHYTFQPNTLFGKKVNEQFSNYYTTDLEYLKDTQTLLKNYKNNEEKSYINENKEKYDKILELWDEIKNDSGFKEKYGYIDWQQWEFLNKKELFLQIMSIYNLTSPILSLLIPFVILIIPFFVIKIKGLNINFTEYFEILKVMLSNHSLGRLFTQFNSVKFDEKIYLLLSAGFYLFSIYQNILTCIRFHENMKKIHTYLESFKQYIEDTDYKIKNFLSFSENLRSYQLFNNTCKNKLLILKECKENLDFITEYKFQAKKLFQFGHVLKYFYELHDNSEYNDAFLYSFGFHGYLDNIQGLILNIESKKINYVNLANKPKKKKNNKFKNLYYPALIHSKPILNSYSFKKNSIITGPNASGKTTILKSVLINIILSQQVACGCYESGQLYPFKYIHCYLNIPDTSGRDSLFQAEARRTKEILDMIHSHPKQTHFCVFDELYSGTNPEEAVLSGTGFLKYIVKYSTVDFILTTHFIKLCKHLEKNERIQNYHMNTQITGEKDFIYTYQLKKGISNVNGGMKILNDMNYPKEIITTYLSTF
jgi:DNA mismatch repair ATPase MutS